MLIPKPEGQTQTQTRKPTKAQPKKLSPLTADTFIDTLDDHLLHMYSNEETVHINGLVDSANTMQRKLEDLVDSGTASEATIAAFKKVYKKRLDDLVAYARTLKARYEPHSNSVKEWEPKIESDPLLSADELTFDTTHTNEAGEKFAPGDVGAHPRSAPHLAITRTKDATISPKEFKEALAEADRIVGSSDLVTIGIPDGYSYVSLSEYLEYESKKFRDEVADVVESSSRGRRALQKTLLTGSGMGGSKLEVQRTNTKAVFIPKGSTLDGTTFVVHSDSNGNLHLDATELSDATTAYEHAESTVNISGTDVNGWSDRKGIKIEFGTFVGDDAFDGTNAIAYATNYSIVRLNVDRVRAQKQSSISRVERGGPKFHSTEEVVASGEASPIQTTLLHELGHIAEFKNVPKDGHYKIGFKVDWRGEPIMENGVPIVERTWFDYDESQRSGGFISEYADTHFAEHIAESIALYLTTGEITPEFKDFLVKYQILNGGKQFMPLVDKNKSRKTKA